MSTFSLERVSETGYLDAKLKLRHCKLHLLSRLMEIKSISPKVTQKRIAKE